MLSRLCPILASLLQDLHQRIDRFRASPPLEGSRFHYGFNSNYLKKVVSYWRNEFDWRKQVDILNQYPHFKTKIEGEIPEQQPGWENRDGPESQEQPSCVRKSTVL